MPFDPETFQPGSTPLLVEDGSNNLWEPMHRQTCTFGPDLFMRCMMNMIRNPNLNSSWLFRADILYDSDESETNPSQTGTETQDTTPNGRPYLRPRTMNGMQRDRIMLRRLIPRNDKRDSPMDQTCEIHRGTSDDGTIRSLVLYVPHVDSLAEMPFYHPKAKGVAHLHEWNPQTSTGHVSVSFFAFPELSAYDTKLHRIAYHLLELLCKHGSGQKEGYVKRVHHDLVIKQSSFQDRYSTLKNTYAKQLITSWAESTDPSKHVFEDLGIASFLIELWKDMYKDKPFPGFVDIGCGNGLLVWILNQEGFHGWGFDARKRKSWAQYASDSKDSPSGSSLEERLLLPSVINDGKETSDLDQDKLQDGKFPPGTFIVSNHADELTPWTPILATASECPFIMIPCCSHNLAGDKYRAPAPRDKTKSKSGYASLVDWASQIAEDCGWEVETEMLRIPSTRNTCLLGRKRTQKHDDIDIASIVQKFGGAQGYHDNVVKLMKTVPRGH